MYIIQLETVQCLYYSVKMLWPCTLHVLCDEGCNGSQTKTEIGELENRYTPHDDPVCKVKTEFSENTDIPSFSIHREAQTCFWFHSSA